MFERKTCLLIRIAQRSNQAVESTSIFRLYQSEDGRTFYPTEGYDSIFSAADLEEHAVEDCRVTEINGIYYLTYTMFPSYGAGVGLLQTRDWKRFDRKGTTFPPDNRGCTIFEEKIRDRYYALHAPGSPETGKGSLWIADSPDAVHWGNHQPLATTRENMWDGSRIVAGGSPIETPQGWLVIYNGVGANGVCSLGALLLRTNEPWRVIARSESPLMEPTEPYESSDSFGNGICSNGHLVVGDKLRLYYSARDEAICGAELSIHEILNSLSLAKD